MFSEDYAKLNRNFNKVCITHSTSSDSFFNILNTGVISLPNSHSFSGFSKGFIDRLFNLDNVVFLKTGFAYVSSDHKSRFAFIFKPSIFDPSHMEFFKIDLVHYSYKELIRFWFKNEPELIVELKKNHFLKHEIPIFLKTDSEASYRTRGLPNGQFAFFKDSSVEPLLHKMFNNSKTKHKLTTHLLKLKESLTISHLFKFSYLSNFNYEYSDCNIRGAELISHTPILIDSPKLMGFFVARGYLDSALPRIKKFIEKSKHVDKVVIFDGYKTTTLYKSKFYN